MAFPDLNPLPSTSDPVNFAAYFDALLAKLPSWGAEAEAVEANVETLEASASAAAAVKNTDTYKGVYSAGTTYAQGESVRYDGMFWLSNVAGNVGNTPVDGAYWSPVTATPATQTQMEAASSSGVVATPSNVNWHPGVAKAWIKCNAAGAIAASHNITSITDDGSGLVTVTIATDFSSANYSVVPGVLSASDHLVCNITAQTAGAFSADSYSQAGGVYSDPTAYFFACFGDQA